ncbi:G-protein coupled receptor GRL101-like [Amphiura filiformis]|uniref:G-protein coupled receptor GRL101-like n=1 Tax=Amphiura filiformis TaxID=82378 RepID=UPI003B226F4A
MEDRYDFLYFGNGEQSLTDTQIVQLTGLTKIQSVASLANKMWILMTTDRTRQTTGFELEIMQTSYSEDICNPDEFDCGNGICVDTNAECDGFNDCVNWAEENKCAYVTCPTAYLCHESDSSNVTMCLSLARVCDGSPDCIEHDDETECDTKRCPSTCVCSYSTVEDLVVDCPHGWTVNGLDDIPPISDTLHLTDGNFPIPEPGVFKALKKLKALSLSRNRISYMTPRVFDGLGTLTWLILIRPKPDMSEDADLVIESNAFHDIHSLETLFCDYHALCCFFNELEQCTTLEPVPPLFNCGSLMQNNILRISMWILGVSALIGNLFVLFFRVKEESPSTAHYKQRLFITSLAFSDFLMGVYMIILASADVYYGDDYFTHSDKWRSGLVCKAAGFIGLFSSEASVFFITLITVDRFICILFPFSDLKLRKGSSQIAIVLLWSLAVIVALVPILLSGPESDFYDLSDVCMGLPLITRPSSYSFHASDVNNQVTFDLPVAEDSKPAWYFSIAIFLVLNLVCFAIICVCYIAIFVTVKLSGKKVGREEKVQEDIKMAAKMAAVVGTDFLCWFPVIIMGILSQTGAVVIPLDAYVWSVVFILPVNSSLNPYLYTIASVISERRDGKMTKPRQKTTVSMVTN